MTKKQLLTQSVRGNDKLSNHRGMFLLEAILATVIMAVSISVIIESLVSGLRATKLTSHYSKAILLADHSLSDILHQRSVDAVQNGGQFSAPDEQYRHHLKSEAIGEAGEGLKEVELTVSWKSGRKEENISVATWIFEPPKKDEKQN